MTRLDRPIWRRTFLVRTGVLIVSLCLGNGCSHLRATVPAQAGSDEEIRAVLARQASAWNAGNLGLFMETYIKTDELRFASGGAVRRGWDQTLDRYRRRYPTREAMGQVSFANIEIKRLSPDWAEVFGEYNLQRGGTYPNASGLFTLLLFRTSSGWKILHDHTSAAE